MPLSQQVTRLEVWRTGQPRKKRVYHHIPRMGANHDLGVFNNNVDAVERSILERYMLVKVGEDFLPPLASVRGAWDTDYIRRFRAGVAALVRPRATVITLPEVVNCYRGAKRNIYANALRSLYRNWFNKGDASLRPFTKFEKQSLLKAPRIINPRSPRYNLMLGKYLKKNEKLYYWAINSMWGARTRHTVIKGLNVFQQAEVLREKWQTFKDPVALGLDATKFDMHVGIDALNFEHSVYTSSFMRKEHIRELKTLLGMQLHNRGKAYCCDGVVDFRVLGTRCSGDLNTSLGNCLIMCALLYDMCKQLGVDAELANNGDDCVLFMEREDLSKVLAYVPTYFENHGFRMTVEEPVYDFERVEFCQSRPVKLAKGWAMVRNVRTCLQKDPMCLIPIQNDKVWRKWLAAVGECGLSLVPGCPVLQSFYECFRRNGSTANSKFKAHVFKNTSMLERGQGLSAAIDTITDDARASFYRSTGITPDYQIALEEYYDRLSIGGIEHAEVSEGLVENAPPAFLRHL